MPAPTPADVIGSIGVTLLLAAFAAQGFGKLRADSRAYAAVNVIGAGLAAIASAMIDYLPFLVLEATWCAVALVQLLRPRTADRSR